MQPIHSYSLLWVFLCCILTLKTVWSSLIPNDNCTKNKLINQWKPWCWKDPVMSYRTLTSPGVEEDQKSDEQRGSVPYSHGGCLVGSAAVRAGVCVEGVWQLLVLLETVWTHTRARARAQKRERERGAGRQMMQEGQRLEVCAVKNVRLQEGLGRKTNLQGDPFSKL